eukprot:2551500-Prymnesium_polylepis.1
MFPAPAVHRPRTPSPSRWSVPSAVGVKLIYNVSECELSICYGVNILRCEYVTGNGPYVNSRDGLALHGALLLRTQLEAAHEKQGTASRAAKQHACGCAGRGSSCGEDSGGEGGGEG